MGFMRWCNVVVVLNAMHIFVFLNKLLIFLNFGLWKVNVVQLSLSFLLVFFFFVFCLLCVVSVGYVSVPGVTESCCSLQLIVLFPILFAFCLDPGIKNAF